MLTIETTYNCASLTLELASYPSTVPPTVFVNGAYHQPLSWTSYAASKWTGSVFGLQPDTEYVASVTYDGTTYTETFRTRADAVAGPITQLPTTGGTHTLSQGGHPGAFAVYEGGVVDGLVINGSNIIVRNCRVGAGGITGNGDWVVIGDCEVTAHNCIMAKGNNWTVETTKCVGNTVSGDYSGEGVQFHQTTRGGVCRFNDISGVADGVSYGNGHIDVHDNVIHDVLDDFVEPDYAYDNYRVFRNLCYNGGNHGFSFQPMKGGPWYFLNNQLTGIRTPLKPKVPSGDVFFVNNTIQSYWTAYGGPYVPRLTLLWNQGGIWANNLWSMEGSKQYLGNGPDFVTTKRIHDYNAYQGPTQQQFMIINSTWQSLAAIQAKGIEQHSQLVSGVVPTLGAAGTAGWLAQMPGGIPINGLSTGGIGASGSGAPIPPPPTPPPTPVPPPPPEPTITDRLNDVRDQIRAADGDLEQIILDL